MRKLGVARTSLCLALIVMAMATPAMGFGLHADKPTLHHTPDTHGRGSNSGSFARRQAPATAAPLGVVPVTDTINRYLADLVVESVTGVGTTQSKLGYAFSGFNIHHAIALLVAGARTPDLFLAPLYANVSYADYIAGVNFVLTSVQNSGANVSIASSVWVKQPINITTSYQTTVTTQLLGTTASVPLLNETAINIWVAAATYGKITQVVDSSVREMDAVLASAFYFKDAWKEKFVPEPTASEFQVLATSNSSSQPAITQVQYMVLQTRLDYINTDAYTAVRVPFNHTFDAYFVMQPDAATGGTFTPPADLANNPALAYLAGPLTFTPFTTVAPQDSPITSDKLPKAPQATSAKMNLVVPRLIELESQYDLLQMWGSNTTKPGSGSRSRDYSVLTRPFAWLDEAVPFVVTGAIHKATLTVNENGTEASAATVVMVATSAGTDTPPTVKFNKPFLFHLVHRGTNVILFSALYAGPAASSTLPSGPAPAPSGTQGSNTFSTSTPTSKGGAAWKAKVDVGLLMGAVVAGVFGVVGWMV